MKYNKICRIMAAVFVLSLLAVTLPATPVMAARVIELDLLEGKIGDTITITGTGFMASTETTERYVDVYFARDVADTSDDIDYEVDIISCY